MKNYREVADAVLERRDAYQKAKKHKQNIVIRTAAGGSALCLMALLGFGLYRSGGINPDNAERPLSDSDVYYALSDSDASHADGANGLYDMGNAADDTNSLPAPADNTDSNGLTASAENADSNGLTASTENVDGNSLTAPTENADSNGHTLQQGTAQKSVSAKNGMLPVSYSSLSLPQGQVRPDIISEYAASSQSSAEILPFSEELLSKSSAILEGKITDMYLKRYSYDTYNDKFGPKEIYHNQSSSVVYELTVDKVWYGDESLVGTSVLIEDDVYLMDPYFSLKVGCRYVIPVSDLDEKKWIWEEYAGGDLTRDGRYTSLYPHHPQIEVTEDGEYIVTADWETLCADSAKSIWLDIPENKLVEYHPENPAGENGLITTEWRTLLVSAYDAVYYYDKLKLVPADDFLIQLNQLINQLKP